MARKRVLAGVKRAFGALLAGACVVGASSGYAATNLVTNGSFEEPAIGFGSWGVFWAISGWTTSYGCGIEIQNNVAGSPFEGAQHVELDSNCSSGMYQDIATEAGKGYLLKYAYSPRPGVEDNSIKVSWDGAGIQALDADGSALGDTSWEVFTHVVSATGASTTLEFDDTSFEDSLGGYVDDVSLVAITYESVCEMVHEMVENAGIANSLCVKLEAAAAAEARGNVEAEAGALNAFRHEVNAQTGKALSADDAALLLEMADTL